MVMSWQPIETAHKDGTAILVRGGEDSNWEDYSFEEEGYVNAVQSNPLLNNLNGPRVAWWDGECWVIASYDSDCGSVRYENPTHWMLIPEFTE